MKLIFILALLFYFPNAFSYEFTEDFKSGIYWPNYPIPMNLYVDNSSGLLSLSQIVAQAESEWEKSIGQEIWNINYMAVANSGNLIRWSKNFSQETGFDSSTTLAVTIRTNDGSYFQRVEIILNGQNQILIQNINSALKKTILHELGHSIGLDHSDQDAIMQAYISYLDKLTSDDINGAINILDENTHRKDSGFRASLNGEKLKYEQNALACGSINLNESGGSGPISFILGLVIFFLFFSFFNSFRYKFLIRT